MSDIRIWKILSFLLFGLFVLAYIVGSTIADIYFLKNDPVAGISYNYKEAMGGALVERVVPKGPADEAGMQEGDIIVAINGKVITRGEDMEEPYAGIRPGQEISFLIQRQDREITLSFTASSHLEVYTSTIFFGLLPGIFFSYTLCLIGLYVLFKRISDSTSHVFYLLVMFWALAMWHVFPVGSNALHKILPSWLSYLQYLYFPIAIGLLVHFTYLFPVESERFKQRPWPYFLMAYGSLLLLIPYFYAFNQNLPWAKSILNYGWGGWFALNFFIAMNNLGQCASKAPNTRVAEQAKIIYRGTLTTLAVPIGIYFLPLNFLGQRVPYAEYVLLTVVLWPLTLAYVIVRHRFMDVDVIVKRGVAYALISGIAIAAYFVFVVGIGKLVLLLTGSTSQLVTIIATLLIAALFNPVKNRIQKFVDKRFFPSRLTYREAVRSFTHELVNVVDLQALHERLLNFFVDTMRIEPVAIFWSEKQTNKLEVLRASAFDGTTLPDFHFEDEVIQQLHKKQDLLDFSEAKHTHLSLSEDESARWMALQSELIIPLLSRRELRGFISIGGNADGELYHKEDIDLLETLSNQINTSLANALLTEELRGQERMKKELEVARQIQLSSLPQTDPDIPGLDVSGVSIPALEVGGDYYDYLHFPDGRFGVVVGDVSGKGTSAALYMTQLKGILRTASKFHLSLCQLMAEVNAVAFESIGEQSFITLSCVAFDLKKRTVSFVRAGHLPLIHYSAQKGKCEHHVPRGIGVGLECGEVFDREMEEIELKFDSGDIFFLYSDGVIEARNAYDEEIEDGVFRQIIEQNGYVTACDLREKIISAVHDFSGDTTAHDDMTVVIIRIP